MNDLQKYSQFSKSKRKERKLPTTREVALHKVSSKNQKENYSLGCQKEEAEKFAQKRIPNY